MVLIDIDWLNGGFGFDDTGDIRTVEGSEALGSYLALQITDSVPNGGEPINAEQVKRTKSRLNTILSSLQSNGHIGSYGTPRVRDDGDTLLITVTVDGSVVSVPTDDLSG